MTKVIGTTQEALDEFEAQIRREQYERDCAAMCKMCAEGSEIVRNSDEDLKVMRDHLGNLAKRWAHVVYDEFCPASPIHEQWHKGEAEDEQ